MIMKNQVIKHRGRTLSAADLAQHLADLPYADIAERLGEIDLEDRLEVFGLLPELAARGGFLAMDAEAQASLLEEMPSTKSVEMATKLPANLVARICEVANVSLRDTLLRQLPADKRQSVATLLSQPVDSAGRIMQTDYVSVAADATVSSAREAIRQAPRAEDLLFVHELDGRLKGVVRVARLLRAPESTAVVELLEQGDSRVAFGDNREHAAHLLQSRGLPAVAVVGDDGRQVGIVRFDEAMDVLETETSEDMYRKAGLGGISKQNIDFIRSERLTSGGIGYSVRVRLMFLMVTLAGGLAVGGLIDNFEEVLSAVVAIAIFIPLIMDMGGNVGTQSTTIFARGYALGHINTSNGFFRRHVLREATVGLSMALLLGTVAGVIAWLWQGIPNDIPILGLAVGVSLAFSVLTASVLGFLLPWVMLKIGVDHAPGADPFITTIKDFSGLAVYFVLCAALLQVDF